MRAGRCFWCGQLVKASTPVWTFLSWYGRPLSQTHCPRCRDACRTLIVLNLLARRT